jgi:hypothetical protein
MSEYKFNCPGCGQHILANEEWGGRQINCPSCKTRITIPSPAKELKKNPPVMPPAPSAHPKLPGGSPQAGVPVKEAGTGTAPAPALPAPKKEGQTATTSPAKEPKKIAPVMPPAPSAQPKLPGGPVQANLPAKEAGTVIAPTPALPAPKKEGQAAKTSPAKEPKKHPPVMPPAPSAQPKLPGGALQADLPAKAAATVTAPAPTLPASGEQGQAATTSPAKTPKENVPPAAPLKSTGSKLPGDRLRVELPTSSADTGTTPATPAPSAQEEGQVEKTAATAPETKPEAAATAPKPAEPPQVAVLSPGVKLDMVRAVRRRIADESAWLPGKVKDATAYAAKMQDGELVLLEATSPEASQFSLIGAFLLEMHARRVVKTAVGRKRFLDEEIPDAVHELLLEQMSDEEREQAEDPQATTDALSISHAQCLAVLDVLEARYSQRVEQRQIESAKRKLGRVRLPDLVNKLEKKVPLTPEEVATALYHELMEVRRRLDRLESKMSQNK